MLSLEASHLSFTKCLLHVATKVLVGKLGPLVFLQSSAYLGRIIRQHGSRYVLGSQFPTKDILLLGA
jgi:hypothetical protein